MADFYQMQAEKAAVKAEVTAAKSCEPRAETIYLVGAWDRGWSIRRKTSAEEYLTREAAEKAVAELPNVWSNAVIIQVDFPGRECVK